MAKTKAPEREVKETGIEPPELPALLVGNVTDAPAVQDMTGVSRLAVNIGVAVPWDPNQTALSAGGAAVSISLTPASPNDFVEVGQIEYSYSAAPTGGGITITDGGATVYQLDANSSTGAAQQVQYLQPRVARAKGNTIVITLASGGGAIVGKLNVEAWVRR